MLKYEDTETDIKQEMHPKSREETEFVIHRKKYWVQYKIGETI